jgi:hypothetical protein
MSAEIGCVRAWRRGLNIEGYIDPETGEVKLNRSGAKEAIKRTVPVTFEIEENRKIITLTVPLDPEIAESFLTPKPEEETEELELENLPRPSQPVLTS